MKKIRILFTGGLAFTLLFAAQPAIAADDENVAILALLGLEAAKGDTKVNEKGGALESYILSTYMLKSAGSTIESQIKADPNSPVLLLAHNDVFDLRAVGKVRARITWLDHKIAAVKSYCDQRDAGTEIAGLSLSAASISQAVTGLIKTDREISGIDVSVDDQMLMNAIAGAKPSGYIIPGENVWLGHGIDSNSVLAKTTALQSRAEALSKRDCAKEDQPKAALSAINKMFASLTSPGDKQGPSLLEVAMQLEGLSGGRIRVLRVKSIKAGGTLIKRNNIFTTLGASSVTITGGFIATFRLINPKTGVIEKSGSVVCRTKARGIRSINGGNLTGLADAANCELIV